MAHKIDGQQHPSKPEQLDKMKRKSKKNKKNRIPTWFAYIYLLVARKTKQKKRWKEKRKANWAADVNLLKNRVRRKVFPNRERSEKYSSVRRNAIRLRNVSIPDGSSLFCFLYWNILYRNNIWIREQIFHWIMWIHLVLDELWDFLLGK